MWDDDMCMRVSWLEFKARVFALLDRPVHRDPFGSPIFSSLLQAKLLRQHITSTAVSD